MIDTKDLFTLVTLWATLCTFAFGIGIVRVEEDENDRKCLIKLLFANTILVILFPIIIYTLPTSGFILSIVAYVMSWFVIKFNITKSHSALKRYINNGSVSRLMLSITITLIMMLFVMHFLMHFPTFSVTATPYERFTIFLNAYAEGITNTYTVCTFFIVNSFLTLWCALIKKINMPHADH